MDMEEICLKYKSVGKGLNLKQFTDRLRYVIKRIK